MDKRKMNYIAVAIVIVIAFCFGTIVGRVADGANFSIFDSPAIKRFNLIGDIKGEDQDIEEIDFDLYWQVWETMKDRYVDVSKVDQEKMFYESIKGFVNSYDDSATIFLDPEETKTYDEGNSGNFFSGIGAELGYKDQRVVVISPLDGSPASQAGIRAGDIIVKVDDDEVQPTDTLLDVVGQIRGETGTKVKLTVVHRDETKETEVEITRAPIDIPSMSVKDVPEQQEIKLIDLSRFTEGSVQEWKSVWDSAVSEVVDSGAKYLILDLRGNPGGYLDAAVYAAEEFMPKGTTVLRQSNREGKEIVSKVTRDGRLLDIKLVVLVNEGSASASEILAGALAQNDRAKVVGEDTFGKGTAQNVIPLENGASLHITVYKWLLPDGTWINKDNKIQPDINISLTDEDFMKGEDPQMDKAIEVVKE